LRVLEQEQLIKPSSHGAVAGDAVERFIADFENNVADIISRSESIKDVGKTF
jgi:predicted transcriptional regulator